ncbi:MAG: hypothetical protein N2380_08565 [bacterium]|nr:hypothetical protein [bacterium]
MCVIAVCEERKLYREEIELGWDQNPHGAGIGWVEDGRTVYIKGIMDIEELIEIYERINIIPHIVHFRYASMGIPVNPKLTHPFIVSKSSPIRLKYKGVKPIIFHNGTINKWREFYKLYIRSKGINIREDSLSDTRVMAMIWAEKGKEAFNLLNPGRVALMYPSGEIERYGNWSEKDGIYLSNNQLI